MQVGHAQLLYFRLDFAFVPDIRLGELVFEKTFVVVPGVLGWSFGQARQILWIGDRFAAAALCRLGLADLGVYADYRRRPQALHAGRRGTAD